jgi:hypothetical protein
MLSHRLIRVLESHAEALTEGTIQKLQTSPRTPSYHQLSREDLYERAYAVYHDLGAWLGEKTESAIKSWYHKLGEKRFDEGIPLAEVLWALILTKHELRDDLGTSALADSAMELYRQQEVYRLIGEFFDRAVCYTAEGYENQARRNAELVASQHRGAGHDGGRIARPRQIH